LDIVLDPVRMDPKKICRLDPGLHEKCGAASSCMTVSSESESQGAFKYIYVCVYVHI
jgi:hypothetical protein